MKKDGFNIDDLKSQLEDISEKNNDKISRSTVRRWMVANWVPIVTYLLDQLVKGGTTGTRFAKIESIRLKVISVIGNFLNYRIISDLSLTPDEANTKFDQVLVKHIGRISANFTTELAHLDKIRRDITVNIKDNAGFIIVIPNMEIVSAKRDIVYDSDLKQRRVFALVKRDESFIKYERGMSLSELQTLYPDTTMTMHGIDKDVPTTDIVYFDGIDSLYRSFPADMSYGLKEMETSADLTIVSVMDQKRLTGTQISFFDVKNSTPKTASEAAAKTAKRGIYNILTKDIVDSLERTNGKNGTNNMTNSFIVWDGHPSTFKLGGESNHQLIYLRHVDFEQTVTKSIKDTNWTSEFINALILITTGDNMFNITGSTDKMREGLGKDQRSLRESEAMYPDLVKKQTKENVICIKTNGDVNISSKTSKSMRDSYGLVTINSTHGMNVGSAITEIITKAVAYIKLTPEHDHTISKFEIIKSLSVPAITRSYEESEDSREHKFFMDTKLMDTAAQKILIDNETTRGPISNISSVISTKDLTSAAFGSVPALEVLSKDESNITLASDTFAPFAINQTGYVMNSGCVNGDEMDASTTIKYYGKGVMYKQRMEDIIAEALNNISLSVHPTDFTFTQTYQPLEFQTLNNVVNNCTPILKTKELRDNQYSIVLKLSRAFTQDLIYTYGTIELSDIAHSSYKSLAEILIESLTYNPYFYLMLSMKFDLDSRYSNEILAVWDSYLKALEGYSDLERVVIHHLVMQSSAKSIGNENIDLAASEQALQEERDKLIKSYKGKQEYFTQAVIHLEKGIEDESIDVKAGFQKDDLTLQSDVQDKVNTLQDDKVSLEEQLAESNKEIAALKAAAADNN